MVYRRRTKISKAVSLSCEPVILGPRPSNKKEPNRIGDPLFQILHLLLVSIAGHANHHLEGVDLLKGERGTNLYTLSLEEMMQSSPVCLLSKTSKTKYWLWHRRLSYLNFGAINDLAKQGLVRGLPKLKYQKDHLCSAVL
nr:integrase, catalytic region, zinc finger, CCHC-type, peptidase aspartic, catalytic [Tanacetum cinerariifolium]